MCVIDAWQEFFISTWRRVRDCKARDDIDKIRMMSLSRMRVCLCLIVRRGQALNREDHRLDRIEFAIELAHIVCVSVFVGGGRSQPQEIIVTVYMYNNCID